jgi:hypothetical protein
VILDHQPVPIEKFNGLYGIDSFTDSVPIGYSVNELNLITYGDEIKTRDGVNVAHSTASVERFAIYRRQGETPRRLVLRSNSIIDLTTGVTILTVSGMTGFAINYANGRAYISPRNSVSGLPGSFVYVYNGTGVARKAAGAAPVAGFTAAISSTAGVIEAGTHIFAWVFETNSGFVTAPSAGKILEFDGTKCVNFSGIPIGPTGTAARRLIASGAIQDYNGNEFGYEMFFVPGGRIDDNTTAVLNDVDFYDADLQLSADYTYDQLAEIPAVAWIRPYGNRMGYGGSDTNKSLSWFSHPNEPESIHSSAGFVTCDPHETEGVKDGVEFRDNFYIMKRNKTITVRDNGFEPSTWKPVDLDGSIGCDMDGIGVFYDTSGTKVEWFTVTSPSGIFKFNGFYEEIPITYYIKAFWDRLNKNIMHKFQTLYDQEKLLLYILVSLDGAAEPNYIFVGNYENGFQFNKIKWHLWYFADFAPSGIAIDRDSNQKPILKVSSLSGNIYGQEVGRKNDVSTAIPTFIQFGPVGSNNNSIHHCGGVGLRIRGLGTLSSTLYGHENIDMMVLRTLTLVESPGKDYILPAFFQSEKISLKLELNAVGAYMQLLRANVYTNVVFESRPNF